MAYHQGSFLAALGAASSDDPVLLAELRSLFVDSIERQIDLLRRARCDGNWRVAAERLRAIAGSCHAEEVQQLADEAIMSAPGEPTVIASLVQVARQLRGVD